MDKFFEIYSTEYYEFIYRNKQLPVDNSILIHDHIGGFNSDYSNDLFDFLNEVNFNNPILTEYIFHNSEVLKKYKHLNLVFSADFKNDVDIGIFLNYNIHPELKFKNMLCSFNGSDHVSRQLLTSTLQQFGLFNKLYSSKNFSCNALDINGHLMNLNLSNNQQRFYDKFFTDDSKFLNEVYSFNYERFDHNNNIRNLETILTESFVHIVSETMATSYYPFVTEKFLYSVVTRGLFLSYAQPGWHLHVEKYYGFKKYNKIFDYKFDDIKNPVERLVELITMISKFSVLTTDDWHDLYLIEQDTIEYNYDHYFSKQYLAELKKYEN